MERLYLSSNQISDVSPLASLTNLEWLYLSDNIGGMGTGVSDLSPLASLTNLKWLYLSDNRISDLNPLSALTNLERLDLSDNPNSLSHYGISDVSPLASLTNLKWLYLSSNDIEYVWPLIDNTGLGEGDLIDLRENPLSDRSLNNEIPVLEARGVLVHY